MTGMLEQDGDRWQLRFERRFDAPVQTVWRTLTDPAALAAWFPQRIVGEWRAGAPLRFEFVDHDLPPFDGVVEQFDPPRLLEFSWGTDELRFELIADGNGCVLTLLDRIDAIGKAVRDATGWHTCLDFLEAHLHGDTPPWTSRERWLDLHPSYVDSMPTEAATIGPPVGLQAD
jgi:uncharacterized protein YndB with AHSA1/START domain